MIKKSDVDYDRIKDGPDKSVVLLENGNNEIQGFLIEHIELRQYIEKRDLRGEYSLLTVLIKTNKGIVEMKYDEGFKEDNPLESIALMLSQQIGFAFLINRALIELQG